MLAKVTVSHYTHRETMHCTNYAKKDAKQKFDSIFLGTPLVPVSSLCAFYARFRAVFIAHKIFELFYDFP